MIATPGKLLSIWLVPTIASYVRMTPTRPIKEGRAYAGQVYLFI